MMIRRRKPAAEVAAREPAPRDAPVSTPTSTSTPTPALRTLLALAAAVIVLAGVSFAREVVGPLVLAAVIVIIVHPLRHPLLRRGWPRALATTAVVVVAYVVLAALAALLVFAGIEFAGLVADRRDELEGLARSAVETARSLGVAGELSDAIQSALDPATLLDVASGVGGAVLGVATALFFVLAYVIFMAADGARYSEAERRFGASRRDTIELVRTYNTGVRRYFVVNAAFGAVVAVIDGLALWALGVPAPAVWAILAFVTNFVPNIGFVLGLVPPALLALAVGGWPLMLAVIAIYSVVNVVLQVLIQPKFVSDAVDLTLTLSFFSVVFWTFIIGPLGAILSIPLTLLARALVLGRHPGTAWLRWLSGERVPPA